MKNRISKLLLIAEGIIPIIGVFIWGWNIASLIFFVVIQLFIAFYFRTLHIIAARKLIVESDFKLIQHGTLKRSSFLKLFFFEDLGRNFFAALMFFGLCFYLFLPDSKDQLWSLYWGSLFITVIELFVFLHRLIFSGFKDRVRPLEVWNEVLNKILILPLITLLYITFFGIIERVIKALFSNISIEKSIFLYGFLICIVATTTYLDLKVKRRS